MASSPNRHYPEDLFIRLKSLEDVERIVCEFEGLLFDNVDDADSILDHLVSFERPEVVRLVLSCTYSPQRLKHGNLMLQYPRDRPGLDSQPIPSYFRV